MIYTMYTESLKKIHVDQSSEVYSSMKTTRSSNICKPQNLYNVQRQTATPICHQLL